MVKHMVQKFAEENKWREAVNSKLKNGDSGFRHRLDKDEAQNNLGFGIRKSQKLKERNPAPIKHEGQKFSHRNPIKKHQKHHGKGRVSKEEFSRIVEETEENITLPVNTKTELLHWINGLQDLLLEEQVLENGLNSNKFTGLVESTKEENNQDDGLTYTCPVGMVDMTNLSRYSGAEMNIIPNTIANQLGLVTTELFMWLKGIGNNYYAYQMRLPRIPGWKKEPPKLRKICGSQVDDWETIKNEEESITEHKSLQQIIEEGKWSTQSFEDDVWKMDLIDVKSVDWEELRGKPSNNGEVFNQHLALGWGTNWNSE
ncbi:hypothetical protein MJO29_004271 [Puccinia striiformis f. sp. tritici]|nr:hypothetical protein MJO29_004271 [Puccinia striiformis f. sp. tritici]